MRGVWLTDAQARTAAAATFYAARLLAAQGHDRAAAEARDLYDHLVSRSRSETCVEHAGPPRWITTAEAADELGVTRRRVQQLAAAGRFARVARTAAGLLLDPAAVAEHRRGGRRDAPDADSADTRPRTGVPPAA